MIPGDQAPVSSADRGVYVHFPYCVKKCEYCDFNSHEVAHDDGAYADAVLAELELRAPGFGPGPVRSLFFGGGTPSLWAPSEVARVLGAVEATFGFASDAEVTLEANPGSVVPDRFAAYVDAGVNRFSIGVQSFSSADLAVLGRLHDGEAAARAVRAAVGTGARVSLDLMYALPDQTWADLSATVDRAIDLGTGHVSAYTLTIEPNTVLERRTRLGLFRPMDDDRQAELIERVTDRLGAAGLERYEISSYARPGQEAVHNSLYWTGAPYLGLGAGAHSYLPRDRLAGAERRENVRAPHAYLAAMARRDPTPRFSETLDGREVLLDRLWVGFRPRWGLDLRALAHEAGLGVGLEAAVEPALRRLEGEGLLARTGHRWRPTPRGFLFADHVARTFLDVLPPDVWADLDTASL